VFFLGTIPISFPEQILLNPTGDPIFLIIQHSSQAGNDSLLLNNPQTIQLIDNLKRIHNHFAILYHAENNPTFAMDIEFKITADNRLIIKQARPWVSFERDYPTLFSSKSCDFKLFPNPADGHFNITDSNADISLVQVCDLMGKIILEKDVFKIISLNSHFPEFQLNSGVYLIHCFKNDKICA
jgi:hypothetical protein